MENPVAKRLREVREKLGETQKSMSSRMRLGASTWQGYELRGQLPKTETLTELNRLGFSTDWLLTGQGSMHADVTVSLPADPSIAAQLGDDFVLLPRYDVQASAGNGLVMHSEQIVDYLAFKKEWVRDRLGCNPVDLLLIEANGDSMLPTIAHGDLLLIHIAVREFRDSAIYALANNGALLVKRVERRLSGGVVIKSDNPRYEPETFNQEEAAELRVIGQVLWHGGVL